MNWYNTVSRNLDKIPECIAYFDKELIEAKKQCKIYGSLEKASAALPGIVEQRFSQLQQLEAILEYLNIEQRRLRSQTFKKFLYNFKLYIISLLINKSFQLLKLFSIFFLFIKLFFFFKFQLNS